MDKHKTTRPQVPCSCCKGEGTRPLSTPLWNIYRLIAAKPCTSSELHTRLKGQHPKQFYSNKLGLLYDMGLLVRTKPEGKWIYSTKE